MPPGAQNDATRVANLERTVADLIRRITALEHATHGAPQGPAAPAPTQPPAAA